VHEILAEMENGDYDVYRIFINNLSKRQLNDAVQVVFTTQK
jgi:hypothetical protein